MISSSLYALTVHRHLPTPSWTTPSTTTADLPLLKAFDYSDPSILLLSFATLTAAFHSPSLASSRLSGAATAARTAGGALRLTLTTLLNNLNQRLRET
ncbi:hypothetical protein QYF36_008700 [Acer negundo]|nr:hypothetical protein QYF36_008700 [Acer negundo]